jgi:hypothetical protein
MTNARTQKGFIALMSALVISAVMLLIATGGSLAGFYTRVTSVDAESKERSFFLAESCVDQTLLSLANNPSYAGNATTTVSGSTNGACFTGPIIRKTSGGESQNDGGDGEGEEGGETGGGSTDTYVFRTRGIYQNSYSSLEVTAKVSDLTILSSTQVPVF